MVHGYALCTRPFSLVCQRKGLGSRPRHSKLPVVESVDMSSKSILIYIIYLCTITSFTSFKMGFCLERFLSFSLISSSQSCRSLRYVWRSSALWRSCICIKPACWASMAFKATRVYVTTVKKWNLVMTFTNNTGTGTPHTLVTFYNSLVPRPHPLARDTEVEVWGQG